MDRALRSNLGGVFDIALASTRAIVQLEKSNIKDSLEVVYDDLRITGGTLENGRVTFTVTVPAPEESVEWDRVVRQAEELAEEIESIARSHYSVGLSGASRETREHNQKILRTTYTLQYLLGRRLLDSDLTIGHLELYAHTLSTILNPKFDESDLLSRWSDYEDDHPWHLPHGEDVPYQRYIRHLKVLCVNRIRLTIDAQVTAQRIMNGRPIPPFLFFLYEQFIDRGVETHALSRDTVAKLTYVLNVGIPVEPTPEEHEFIEPLKDNVTRALRK